MASLRRNKAIGTDGTTPKFLYAILKQLDLKSVKPPIGQYEPLLNNFKVDWNHVASNLDITNGHAARMRFSRFKQQMEGIQPPPRKPRNGPAHPKRVKQEKTKLKSKRKTEKELKKDDDLPIKSEPGSTMGDTHSQPLYDSYAPVKSEPATGSFDFNPGEGQWTSAELSQPTGEGFHTQSIENYPLEPLLGPPIVKMEPQIKIEPEWTS